MIKPDYEGGSIVNLMSSIVQALGGEESLYPALRALAPDRLASRNIVLLVIDGLGYENLVARYPRGALGSRLEDRITSVFPSTTATAITSFLTGAAPQQHGLTGWFMYFRELGGVIAVLPYRPRHGGSSPSLAVRTLLGHVPVFDRLPVKSYAVAPERIAHSDFNAAHLGRATLRPFATLEQMFDKVEHIVKAPRGRAYVYAYWPELDRLAHEHGIAGRQTVEHLGQIDAAFADFLSRIGGTDTTVIVTADHGFIDTQPERTIVLDEHPSLARTLLLPLCGEGRAAYCYVRDRERSAFLDYVGTHLHEDAELCDSRALIEAGYFGLGAPHPRLYERVGDYTLVMKRNAIVKDWLPGEPRYVHVGVHGSTSAEEMYVPLIVAQV